jgi:ketosteroid isomerase-like protein
MNLRLSASLLVALLAVAPGLAQSPADEVRATFEAFVAAQNAHDLKAVEALLSDSPNFLWITRGTPVWGRAEAMKRFQSLYLGTWRLEPDYKDFKVVLREPTVAQLFVPVLFSIGPAGQAPEDTRFLMNQTLVRGESGWRIASILPIPVPPPGSQSPRVRASGGSPYENTRTIGP